MGVFNYLFGDLFGGGGDGFSAEIAHWEDIAQNSPTAEGRRNARRQVRALRDGQRAAREFR